MNLIHRVKRKVLHIRLKPIRIFLFHQVSDEYDPSRCKFCDWTQTEVFKKNVLEIQKHYTFVSLTQASWHIKHDLIRLKHFAVLTCDDGASSLKSILPWLKEHGIPVTLFINAKYTDGVSYRTIASERYLSEKELLALDYDGIEIGHHGWEHNDLTQLKWSQFVTDLEKSLSVLIKHPRYVPYWAYTWGRHNEDQDKYIMALGITPVLIDGMKNYNDKCYIHRELLDGKDYISYGFKR